MVAAGVVDEVGRIGSHQHGFLGTEEAAHGAHVGGITAEQPVIAQRPQIAGLGEGVGLCGVECGVGIEVLDTFALVTCVEQLEELGDLVIVEAGEREVNLRSGVQLGK